MKLTKILIAGMCTAFIASAAFAQRSQETVEGQYMTNIEDVIITELAGSQEYESKQMALQIIENSISSGRTSPEMITSLRGLAGEGVKTQARTKGRLMNNYPDVRRKACELLGQVPSEESKNALLEIAREDRSPEVVAAAVRSLGDIGINDNDEVVNTITFIERNYAYTVPTSSLALEILFAYEKLAPTVENKQPMIESIRAISVNYRYNTSVRTYAYNLLQSLMNNNSNSDE